MQLQTAQNELPWFFLKETNLLKINLLRISAKPVQTTSIQYQCLQHQPNTNAHNINPKSMHIATDFLLDGLLGAENFHPSQYASDLSFCAEPKAKSQNPSSQKIILALRERGDRRRRRWVRARKNHFLPPLIRLAGIFSRGRKFSFAY